MSSLLQDSCAHRGYKSPAVVVPAPHLYHTFCESSKELSLEHMSCAKLIPITPNIDFLGLRVWYCSIQRSAVSKVHHGALMAVPALAVLPLGSDSKRHAGSCHDCRVRNIHIKSRCSHRICLPPIQVLCKSSKEPPRWQMSSAKVSSSKKHVHSPLLHLYLFKRPSEPQQNTGVSQQRLW